MHWSPPVLWSVLGLALIALEAVIPGLIILFFGIGALMTALAVLFFDLETSSQVILFACASIACLATLRGTFKKIFQGSARMAAEQLSRLDSFIGAGAVVTEDIPRHGTGRIKARGSFYAATADFPIPAGETVRIVEDVNGDHSLFKVTKDQ